MHQPDIRSFTSVTGNEVLERVSVCDPLNYEFEYQVLNGDKNMPLRDHFKLTKISENETEFNGKLSIYPRPGQDVKQLTAIYNHVVSEAMTKWPTVLVDLYNKSK